MANIGAYAQKLMLDFVLGGAGASAPANRFVALTTGNPSSLSASGELAIADGYARQTLTAGAAASPAGSASNANAMTFGTFSSSRAVSGLLIYDSVSTAAGNELWYGTLLTARTPLPNDTLVVAVGGLLITLA